jgi:hypothetical protein
MLLMNKKILCLLRSRSPSSDGARQDPVLADRCSLFRRKLLPTPGVTTGNAIYKFESYHLFSALLKRANAAIMAYLLKANLELHQASESNRNLKKGAAAARAVYAA